MSLPSWNSPFGGYASAWFAETSCPSGKRLPRASERPWGWNPGCRRIRRARKNERKIPVHGQIRGDARSLAQGGDVSICLSSGGPVFYRLLQGSASGADPLRCAAGQEGPGHGFHGLSRSPHVAGYRPDLGDSGCQAQDGGQRGPFLPLRGPGRLPHLCRPAGGLQGLSSRQGGSSFTFVLGPDPGRRGAFPRTGAPLFRL